MAVAGEFLHSHSKGSLWEQTAFTNPSFAIKKLLALDTVFSSHICLGWNSSLLGANRLEPHSTWTEAWHPETRYRLPWKWRPPLTSPCSAREVSITRLLSAGQGITGSISQGMHLKGPHAGTLFIAWNVSSDYMHREKIWDAPGNLIRQLHQRKIVQEDWI